ncbi:MAG: trimethylamine methyltransferase family protein [Pseudomonadota bacterium]
MAAPASRRGRQARKNPAAVAVAAAPGGQYAGRYRPLSDAEEQQVHETALELLATLGLGQPIPSMIDRVTRAGGRLGDDGRLLFPEKLVLDTIAGARREITLHGRVPGLDVMLSGSRSYFSSGGAAPSLLDFETGIYRDSTLADLYDAARICDALEHVHHFSRSLVARDLPDAASMDINTAYACLAGTAKPVSISITERETVGPIAEICYAIAGGEAAFRARPFLTVMVCHVVPPMRFAEEACETLEAAVRAGFPVQLISAGQAGATSPATIAGSLVQAVAETLAGLVFARLVDPGARAIFAPKPLVADLRTGAMSGGGGEQAVLMAGAAQMGRFYDLPTSSIAGITDAKTVDAQHGAEKTLAVTLAAHAGSNLVTQACGMQASLLGVSLEAYVADNDMLGNIMRTIRGVEVSTETLGADVIAEVCRGEGHYLGHAQTLERMVSDYVYPAIGDRQPPRDWEAAGAQDQRARARARTAELLAGHFPQAIDRETDARLRTAFPIRLPRDRMAHG